MLFLNLPVLFAELEKYQKEMYEKATQIATFNLIGQIVIGLSIVASVCIFCYFKYGKGNKVSQK